MTDRVDAIVIGAGVVGLACARALARGGREVLVLERHASIGEETSSRNSEVIHAGIYYPEGSLKARACVEGKALLYRYCRDYQIPHRRCGKLIVATREDQLEVLEGYRRQARVNGAGDLRWLSRAEVLELEPALECVGGVLSESTGIVDSHALMQSFLGELERHGGALAVRTEVQDVASTTSGLRVTTEALEVETALLINAAGLSAPEVAARMRVAHREPVPKAYYAKGRYYVLTGAPPFHRLVYPVAEAGGLGVHVTLDLGGSVRFGPDVTWCDAPDYAFDDSDRDAFVDSIRRYYPGLEAGRLQPGYVGVRPKIAPPGAAVGDFQVRGPRHHGVAGLVHLFGIESPGLTAALALAQEVAKSVEPA